MPETYEELKRRFDIATKDVEHLARENERLEADLYAAESMLADTESELNRALGKIEGYQESLRLLFGKETE